jgi:copper resistance protein B
MKMILPTLAAAVLAAGPAQAQMSHDHHEMPPAASAEESADPHAGHQMSEPQETTDPHAGHAAPAATPVGVAPPIPADHPAERYFNPADMERSRAMLRYETGGMPAWMIMVEQLEYRAQKGTNGYAWEAEGWYGGDLNRFVFKTEGEGEVGGPLESAEFQALYSRALDPWFNLQLGVRHDVRPQPQRTYAVVGIEGLAPYWFEVGGALFLSDKGDLMARVEANYDQRITQRLILQPNAELNFAAQDVPELGIGSGLSDIELGLRLRYEFVPEFAPYVGVNWERKIGDSARYARGHGEAVSATSVVAGIQFWF